MVRHLLASAGVVLALAGVASADIVTEWNDVLLDAVKTTSTPPPKASRAMAFMNTAIYDAVNAVDRTHASYFVDIDAAAGTSRKAAAAQAAHDVLVHLYPAKAAEFDAKLASQLALIPNGSGKTNGVGLGQNVAGQIIAWRMTDHSGDNVPYTPKDGPGYWRPTPPGFQPALLPGWGQVTPWALDNGAQFRGDGPPALDSAEYAAQVNFVKEIGAKNSATRTAEQTDIAKMWAAGAGTVTPPGLWNQVAKQIAGDRGNSLSDNARMFAMQGVGVADAAIACWEMKYYYEFWRPVTAIREADTDGNDATVADPTWESFLVTPPFPEYTSGHSTFSSVSAALLAEFFGTESIEFSVTSDGITRSFDNLIVAADEAGMSRLYGGIHFMDGNLEGLACGAAIAKWISDNYFGVVPAPASFGALAVGAIAISRRRR